MKYLTLFFIVITIQLNAQNSKVFLVNGEVWANQKQLKVGDELTPNQQISANSDSAFVILLHPNFVVSELKGKFEQNIKDLQQETENQKINDYKK